MNKIDWPNQCAAISHGININREQKTMQAPAVDIVFENINYISAMITEAVNPTQHGHLESIIQTLTWAGAKAYTEQTKPHLANTVTN
ncbi:hypothetical protein [Aeromonas rivipollensis]